MRQGFCSRKTTDSSFIEAAYLDLLDYCKSMKVRIFHRSTTKMKEADGYYYYRMISIKKTIEKTEYGLIVLAHEIGHFLQEKNKEFKEIGISVINQPYTEERYQKIKQYEVDASVKGRDLLFDRYGILVEYEEFDEELLENYFKEYWKKHYFLPEKE